MNTQETVENIQGILAHLWMIRTFLKHADEIQNNEEMLEVPRTLFDFIRASEPAYLRQDWPDFFHRLRGKLPRLKKTNAYYQANYKTSSDHTNFQMAALSLNQAVVSLTALLEKPPAPHQDQSAPPGP
ncbi:MAG: hypothetical protein EXR99_03310 [Gemmataceae bacterium]|nr:hypothetical protein [Gemmataceae bacterium]